MSPHHRHPAARGSALIITVILAAVAALLVAATLSVVSSERVLSKRVALRLETHNAAEALAEWGFYQVRAKVQTASSFTTGMFQISGANALTLPATSFFQGTNINTSTLELFGGAVPASTAYYLDPNDPSNLNDPFKGKYVFRRDIPVYAKAGQTVNGAPMTAYIQSVISIRGAPLFAHAIFYNMDMEINPGPTMTISGPVHANGNIWSVSTGGGLYYQNTITCTGNLYHAWKYVSTTTAGTGAAGAGSGMGTNTNTVSYTNAAGALVNQYGKIGGQSSNTWNDSTVGASTAINGTLYASQSAYLTALSNAAETNKSTFRTNAMTAWNGNVLTAAMGVQNYTPSAIGAYSAQTTSGTDDSVNSARTIIEPPTSTLSAQYSTDVEAQKFSNKACVYIKVTPSTTSPTIVTTTAGAVVTTTTSYPAGTISIYTGGQPSSTLSHLVTNPSVANVVTYKAYKETKTVTSSSTTSYVVNQGMYDQARGVITNTTTAAGTVAGNTDIVELDMNGLRNAITQLTAGTTNTNSALDGLSTSNWNGVVYVEVVGGPTTNIVDTGSVDAGSTNAATNARTPNTGVRIINGTGAVASYGTTTPGLTIATNVPAYIKGSYNADGTTTTTSSTVPETGEKPACIAADAITLLSSVWNDANSKKTVRPVLAAGTKVEIAAALLTGFVPTDKNGNAAYCGGANNLPRFLEDWSTNSADTYIRGSLVCLYESRVATAKFSTNYYKPPDRNWGFSNLFKNGSYPPGTPTVISYRRVNYYDITAAAYATAKAANP